MRPALFVLAFALIAYGVAPASRAQAPAEPRPCAWEYRRGADVTVFGFRASGAGDFVGAAVGPEWRFTCSSTEPHLVRAVQEGTRRTVDVQREPALPSDREISAHLVSVVERANARAVARGFTVDMRMGPRALSPDTVGMAQRLNMDGHAGVQFVVMRALRTENGLLRYTAMEWGEDPSRIETVMDALFHASQQLAPVTPPAP
jgi:hypothetical protein